MRLDEILLHKFISCQSISILDLARDRTKANMKVRMASSQPCKRRGKFRVCHGRPLLEERMTGRIIASAAACLGIPAEEGDQSPRRLPMGQDDAGEFPDEPCMDDSSQEVPRLDGAAWA